MCNAMPRRLTTRLGPAFVIVMALFIAALPRVCRGETHLSDSATALRKAFGDSIEISAAPSMSIEFCPDNTCDVFRTERKEMGDALCDFAYLYLYYVSDYSMLETVRKSGPVKSEAEQILQRRAAGSCRNGDRVTTIGCVLNRLAKENGIVILFVRYDEKERNEQRVDLKQALTRWRRSGRALP